MDSPTSPLSPPPESTSLLDGSFVLVDSEDAHSPVRAPAAESQAEQASPVTSHDAPPDAPVPASSENTSTAESPQTSRQDAAAAGQEEDEPQQEQEQVVRQRRRDIPAAPVAAKSASGSRHVPRAQRRDTRARAGRGGKKKEAGGEAGCSWGTVATIVAVLAGVVIVGRLWLF